MDRKFDHIHGKIKFENFEILEEDFSKPIGKGTFGEVFKVQDKEKKQKYAIKIIQLIGDDKQLISVFNEISIMMSCIHPVFIEYSGFSFGSFIDYYKKGPEYKEDRTRITIFMKFMENGSLHSKINNPEIFNNTNRQIILAGIAYGMKYLHEHRIVHRDLKTLNILLDENLFPIICDFGLSKMSNVGHTKENSRWLGSPLYMSPELHNGEDYDFKIDVFSFAILAYEVATGLPPYPELVKKDVWTFNEQNNFINKVCDKESPYRPKFKDDDDDNLPYSKSFRELIEKCWHHDPEQRPTFEELFKKFSFFYNDDKETAKDYCLKDVDMDKLKKYVDYITMSYNPVEDHLIMNLKKLQNQLQEIKSQVNHIIQQPKENVTINFFNCSTIGIQSEFISKIGDEPNKHIFFTKLKNLLTFLITDNQIRNSVGLEIITKHEEEKQYGFDFTKEYSIVLKHSITESLVQNKNFQSKIKELKFNDLMIEIRYPSDNFKKNSEIIVKNKIKLALFITKLNNKDFIGDKNIKYIKLDTSIKEIKSNNETNGVFEDCSSLLQVMVPHSVSIIGKKSFKGCSSLQKIYIPPSLSIINEQAFLDCSSLTQIIIPSSVTLIDPKCFCGCSKLESVMLPSTITTIKSETFSRCSALKQIIIPNSVTEIQSKSFNECSSLESIIIPSLVTNLGEYSFHKCISLKNIIIPESVISIDDHSFDGCTALEDIKIPNSVVNIGQYAFNECTALIKVEIPNQITKINDHSFDGCTALEDIKIPNSVVNIGQYAFNKCSKLDKVSLPDEVELIDDRAFAKSKISILHIPSSVKCIGKEAFLDCQITELLIPPKIEIKEECFNGCIEIHLVKGLTSIPKNAFDMCSTLMEITIPSSVNNISPFAFKGCLALRKVHNSSNVKSIGKNAFQDCTLLERIRLPYSIETIGEYAFAGCQDLVEVIFDIFPKISSFNEYTFYQCENLESFTIPSSIKSIGKRCFSGTSLVSIEIPNSVEIIGEKSFAQCPKLKQLTISSSVKRIDGYAFTGCEALQEINFTYEKSSLVLIGCYSFAGCSALEKIVLPSVNEIGDQAFANCYQLNEVVIHSATRNIGHDVFQGCINLIKIIKPRSLQLNEFSLPRSCKINEK